MLDVLDNALGTVKTFLPEDNPVLKNSFDMVREFVGSLGDFMLVLNPDSAEYLDLYCRGMIFGLHGSGVLVKLANMIRNQDLSSIAVPGKKGKKKGGQADLLSGIREMGGSVLGKVAQEMVNRGMGADEL